MGESAKILSPQKTIILPATNAGCPMADMACVEDLEEMIKLYPDAFKVCYINSSYEVKALCDVSVTSSSALDILKNVENKQILFLPDRNLGSYIAEFFPEKEFIFWQGFCPTHERISVEDILTAKEKHPQVKVLAHPECNKEVRDLCDYIGSTSGIIDFATKCEDEEFIICTEEGILYELEKNNPNKKFYFPERIVCPNMKKTNLQNVYDALCGKVEEVVLDEEIAKKALIVASVAFVAAGWWFVRNAILYDGDILGTKTQNEYGNKYAMEQYKPSARKTPENSNESLWYMLDEGGWIHITVRSFVGMFGYQNILMSDKIYYAYFGIWMIGGIGCLLKFKELFIYNFGFSNFIFCNFFVFSLV